MWPQGPGRGRRAGAVDSSVSEGRGSTLPKPRRRRPIHQGFGRPRHRGIHVGRRRGRFSFMRGLRKPAPRQTPIIAKISYVSTRAAGRIKRQSVDSDGLAPDGGMLPVAPGPRVGAGVAVRQMRTSSSSESRSQPSGIGKRRLRVDPDWKHSQPWASALGVDPSALVIRTGEAGRTSHTSQVMPMRSTKVLCAISVRRVSVLPARGTLPKLRKSCQQHAVYMFTPDEFNGFWCAHPIESCPRTVQCVKGVLHSNSIRLQPKPSRGYPAESVDVRFPGPDHALVTGKFVLTGAGRPDQTGWFTTIWRTSARVGG